MQSKQQKNLITFYYIWQIECPPKGKTDTFEFKTTNYRKCYLSLKLRPNPTIWESMRWLSARLFPQIEWICKPHRKNTTDPNTSITPHVLQILMWRWTHFDNFSACPNQHSLHKQIYRTRKNVNNDKGTLIQKISFQFSSEPSSVNTIYGPKTLCEFPCTE